MIAIPKGTRDRACALTELCELYERVNCMYTITVANQKGGVSKTSTVMALGACLARAGYRVLFCDCDPQANLTTTMQDGTAAYTLYDVLQNGRNITDAITPAKYGKIVPSDVRLAELNTNTNVDLRALKSALEAVKTAFDVVLIDTPPAISVMTLYGLFAADGVLCPMLLDRYSIDGLDEFYQTFTEVKQTRKEVGVTGTFKLLGFVISQYDKRVKLNQKILDMLTKQANDLKIRIYTPIRRTTAVDVWQYTGDIFAGKSTAIQDYQQVANDLVEDIKLKRR